MISLRAPRAASARLTISPTVLHARVLTMALACLLGALTAGVVSGPVRLGMGQVMRELVGHLPLIDATSGLSERDAAILWQLRIPRVVLGGLVGAMLSASGAAYQGVFRNSLADPYLLGAASGAGLGATLAIQLGGQNSSRPLLLPMAAFAGALLGVGMAYLLGRSVAAGSQAGALILAGVAVASFLTAIQTYLFQRDDETFREVYGWILGRLTTSGWREVLLILPYVTASAVALLLHRRLLDVLSVGDEESQSLGIRSTRVRVWVVTAASLGTAAAVAVSGLIGFVGIIVPHTVRLIVGPSYRLLMPLSLVFGAAFLVLADVIARTVLAPAELPIGVVTAFFGAPFFAMLLRTRGRALDQPQ